MKKLILLLPILACTITKLPEPKPQPPKEAEFYTPSKIYAMQVSCALTMAAQFGVECTAIPKQPVWADCLPNYHKERQILCTAKSTEPSESRIVCHLNLARGYTHLCGMECTMNARQEPQIIIPPSLDRQEASVVK